MTFTKSQLLVVEKALALAEKSASRLASREGQPEAVAAEYRRYAVEVAELIKSVQMEIVSLEKQVKK